MTIFASHEAGLEGRELPPLVARYLDRARVNGHRPHCVRLAQVGQMWQRPRGRPHHFTAVEELAVGEVAFTRRARYPVGLASVEVVDRFAGERGQLDARALGIVRLKHRAGPVVAVGEALRYLAELPWVPHAMVANPHLHWHEVDDRTVMVSTELGSEQPTVVLRFDDEGDVVESWIGARPRLEEHGRGRPWSATFSDYGTLGGLRVPLTAEARWGLDGGAFPYWRARLTALELG